MKRRERKRTRLFPLPSLIVTTDGGEESGGAVKNSRKNLSFLSPVRRETEDRGVGEEAGKKCDEDF